MSLWNEFGDAIGRDPLLAVRVVELHLDGTSTVEFPNGSRLRVRGTDIDLGDHAFVRSGEIRGPAPAVVPTELEV